MGKEMPGTDMALALLWGRGRLTTQHGLQWDRKGRKRDPPGEGRSAQRSMRVAPYSQRPITLFHPHLETIGEQHSGEQWEKEKPKGLRSLLGWRRGVREGLSEARAGSPKQGSCGQASLMCRECRAFVDAKGSSPSLPQAERAWGPVSITASSAHQQPWRAQFLHGPSRGGHEGCPGFRNGMGVTIPAWPWYTVAR